MDDIPSIRCRALKDVPPDPGGGRVVYWMTAFRRLEWNYALERAVGLARELRQPLVILEGLRAGYPWASDRHHRFVLDGMRDHARRLAGNRVTYHPYVEPRVGAGTGLLAALAEGAGCVVTDDHPGFFIPRMLDAAVRAVSCRLEAIDSNGLLPVRAADKVFSRAHDFRRFLQKTLPEHLANPPREHPLKGAPLPPAAPLPAAITRRWPAADRDLLDGGALSALPIDHAVPR